MKSGHGAKSRLQKEKAIAALVAEWTVEEASRVSGISVQTLYRWKKEPEFAAAYRKARRANYRQALARLQHSSGAMVAVLLQILFDDKAPASARLDAADLVFRYAKTASETEEVWARMLASKHASEATRPAPVRGHGAKSDAQKEAAIVALLTKRNVQEAAVSVGIGVQTLYRWLQDPGFTFAYLEARMEAFGQAGARLQQTVAKAVATVQTIAGNGRTPASLRVRAVALALGQAQAASDEDIDMYIAASDSAPQSTLGVIEGGRGIFERAARERPKKAA